MPTVTYPHIEIQADGIARIEGAAIKVVTLIEAHLAGEGVAELRSRFPLLSLAQFYSALTYYYDNKPEIDGHIGRRADAQREMERKFADTPLSRKLRTVKGQGPTS